jgi:hypothetical protein
VGGSENVHVLHCSVHKYENIYGIYIFFCIMVYNYIIHRYQQRQRNWWKNLPPVSLILVANLPSVSLIPVVHLELRISPRIFEKIRNGLNGILWGWGERKLIHEKNRSKKSSDTVRLSTLAHCTTST